MAVKNGNTSTAKAASSISLNELVASGTDCVVSLSTFADMVEREIAEVSSTDLCGVEFLMKGACAEIRRLDDVLAQAREVLGETAERTMAESTPINGGSINTDTKSGLVRHLTEAGTLMLALRNMIPVTQDNGTLGACTPVIESTVQKTGALIDRCLQELGEITCMDGPADWLAINRGTHNDQIGLEARRG